MNTDPIARQYEMHVAPISNAVQIVTGGRVLATSRHMECAREIVERLNATNDLARELLKALKFIKHSGDDQDYIDACALLKKVGAI